MNLPHSTAGGGGAHDDDDVRWTLIPRILLLADVSYPLHYSWILLCSKDQCREILPYVFKMHWGHMKLLWSKESFEANNEGYTFTVFSYVLSEFSFYGVWLMKKTTATGYKLHGG